MDVGGKQTWFSLSRISGVSQRTEPLYLRLSNPLTATIYHRAMRIGNMVPGTILPRITFWALGALPTARLTSTCTLVHRYP